MFWVVLPTLDAVLTDISLRSVCIFLPVFPHVPTASSALAMFLAMALLIGPAGPSTDASVVFALIACFFVYALTVFISASASTWPGG